MSRFSIKTLEFDKVKTRAAACAATEMGRDKLLALPVSADFGTVRRMLAETAEAKRLLDNAKRFPFGGLYNIASAVKRAKMGSVLEVDELQDIKTSAQEFAALKRFLLTGSDDHPNLAVYGRELQEFPKLVRQLEKAISEKGEILDTASVKLSGLRVGIASAKNRVKTQLEHILHDPDNQKYFQDALVTMRGDRYVIPIKQEYRLNFPGVIHDQSGTGATLFIEPLAVVNLNNEIKRYLVQEKEEVERILRHLSALAGSEADNLMRCLETATDVDVIATKAEFALQTQAVEPVLVQDGGLRIEKGRHPLLPKDTCVPLDISLGGTFQTLLVTGPNTGGKTVALKATGIFALMAQTGMFIPALHAELPVFHAIYADIGDEQSIEQSLSTFSGHMTNLVSILRDVRPGDLFLVDEICSGTDPNEGAALAMAILDYLTGRGVWSIVTTHYSELKTFAFGRKGMENASVEFNPDTLLPTYRLLMGVPGSSNAFSISRRLGLPDAIIDKAGAFLNEEHAHMEDVIQGLETQRRQYEESSRELEQLRFESETLRNELVFKKREFEKQRNELLRKARYQADEIYRNSRREAEAVLKELRHLRADADPKQLQETAMEARKRLNKQLSLEEPLPKGKPLTPKTAKEGMTVFVTNLRKDGIIREVKGREALVSVGVLKITLPLQECLLVKDAPKPQPERSKYRAGTAHELFVAKAESAVQEVDVRGMTTDEAVPYVDRAIDDALLAGMTQVRIIHGKGTGALRAGLHAYLKTHRSVAAFAMANESLGGAGVTIVTVK
ncbi:MAG: endonuclease MutS2 [Acidaminococcaceae bacterium]|nr:endonuclease MutS2 [Acidaminococcaceae bacterium]